MHNEGLTGELAFAESVSSTATASEAAAALFAYAAANDFNWTVYFPFYSPGESQPPQILKSEGAPADFFDVFLHREYSAFGIVKWAKSPVVNPFLLSALPALADISDAQAGAVAQLRRLVGDDGVIAPTFGPSGRNGAVLFALGERQTKPPLVGLVRLGWVAQTTHAQILKISFAQQFKVPDLTAREYDVYRCIVRGMSNIEIAEVLSLSPNTIDTHIRRLFAKLGVHDRIAAIRQAIFNGLFYQLGGDADDSIGRSPPRK